MVDGWDLAGAALLALGVLALCEALARGVCARGTPLARRVGLAIACAWVALGLRVAFAARFYLTESQQNAFYAHMGLAVLWTLCVHAWHALRRASGRPSFLRSNAIALLGAPPWCAIQCVHHWEDPGIYAFGLIGLGLASFPLRWAWAWAARIVAARWPVQEENVGARMWRFVRPRAVLSALALAVASAAAVDPGGTLAIVGILLAILAARVVYLLLRWLLDPLRERRVWYRPRPEASFALIDALAGAAVAIGAITVACEAMVTRERRAAEATIDAAAEEALVAGMEATWGKSAREIAAAEGTSKTPAHGLPQGELETTVAREEGALWLVRVTVRWKSTAGAAQSRTIETLRSEAGGRR